MSESKKLSESQLPALLALAYDATVKGPLRHREPLPDIAGPELLKLITTLS